MDRFEQHRGSVQSLLSQATSHALSIAHFCQDLPEFWALRDLLPAFVERCASQIIDVVEVSIASFDSIIGNIQRYIHHYTVHHICYFILYFCLLISANYSYYHYNRIVFLNEQDWRIVLQWSWSNWWNCLQWREVVPGSQFILVHFFLFVG